MAGVSAGSQYPTPFAPGTQLRLSHQPSYPFARTPHPLFVQFDMQARTPISALMGVKFLSNGFCQLGIFSFALTGGTLAPGVQATFRDAEHSAHDNNGKILLVFFNKLIDHLLSR